MVQMIPENFNIQTQECGERLIIPGHAVANHQWREWGHRWLRSLHIDSKDRIISLGFPKFMNLGEGFGRFNIDQRQILRQTNQDLWATLKIDGSLLIRFVQDGKVKWRTRGAFRVGVDNAWELDEIIPSYPVLSNPDYRTNDSLMFEWVSPLNQIVIKYDQPAIILVGAARYHPQLPWHEAEPCLYKIQELQRVSEETKVPLL